MLCKFTHLNKVPPSNNVGFDTQKYNQHRTRTHNSLYNIIWNMLLEISMLFTYLFKVTHDWERKCFNFLYTHTYYRQIIYASNKYNDTERMRKLLIFFIMKIGIFN